MTQATSPDWNAVRSYLREWLGRHGWSIRRLARQAGLSPSTFSRFFAEQTDLDEESCVKILEAIQSILSDNERTLLLRAMGLLSVAFAFDRRYGALEIAPPALTIVTPTPARAPGEQAEQVRQITRRWLTASGRSLRSISEQTGLAASILHRFLDGETALDFGSSARLYSAMHRNLVRDERELVLDGLALRPLERMFVTSLGTGIGNDFIGAALVAAGDTLVSAYEWHRAMPILVQAEHLLTGNASLASQPAFRVAELHIQLGNYQVAAQHLRTIDVRYHAEQEPELAARLAKDDGWVSYYRGDFETATQHFRKCLAIANTAGDLRIGEGAEHFLGRIAFDLARQAHSPYERQQLLERATCHFEAAFEQHVGFSYDYGAYDVFRNAQVALYQGRWHDAKALMRRARALFGEDLGYLDIDLEEARIAAENSGDFATFSKVLDVLRTWTRLRRTSGAVPALAMLGDFEQARQHPLLALEAYLTALCLSPQKQGVRYERIRQRTDDVVADLWRTTSQKEYVLLVERLRARAQMREGYFAYLAGAIVDASEAAIDLIDAVMFRQVSFQ